MEKDILEKIEALEALGWRTIVVPPNAYDYYGHPPGASDDEWAVVPGLEWNYKTQRNEGRPKE